MDGYAQLLSGALDLVSGTMNAIPYLVPTQYDKNNKKRLKELERLAEIEALGLTEEEKQSLFSSLSRTAEGGRDDIRGLMEASLQSIDTSGGQALKRAALAQEQAARLETDLGSRVQAADEARAAALAQEFEDRLAYKGQRQQQQIQAATSLFMPFVNSMSESAALSQTTKGETGEEVKTLEEEEEEQLLSEFDDWG